MNHLHTFIWYELKTIFIYAPVRLSLYLGIISNLVNFNLKLWRFNVARCRSVRNIGQKSDQSSDLVPFWWTRSLKTFFLCVCQNMIFNQLQIIIKISLKLNSVQKSKEIGLFWWIKKWRLVDLISWRNHNNRFYRSRDGDLLNFKSTLEINFTNIKFSKPSKVLKWQKHIPKF